MATQEEINASAKKFGLGQKMLEIQQYPLPINQASDTARGNIVGESVADFTPEERTVAANDFASWASEAAEISSPDAKSDFAAWASGEKDTRNLGMALQFGQEQQPDTAARILRLQAKTGLPEEYITENVDSLEKEVSRKEFNVDEYRKKNPAISAWMAKHPNNAAAAQDDLDQLSYIERQWNYITSKFKTGQRNVELGQIGYDEMFGRATPDQLKRGNELDVSMSDEDYGITGPFEQVPGAVAEMLPLQGSSLVKSPQYALAGAAGGAGAGLLGGPAGVVAGATGGAYMGFNLGSGIEAGKMEAGLAYRDLKKLKDDNGAPLSRAAMVGAASIVGIVNGALEIIPAATLAKKMPILRNFSRPGMKAILANRTARKVFLDYAKGIGEQIIAEGGTEFLQEGVKIVAEAATSDKKLLTQENLLQMLAAGKGGMQGGGGMATVTGAMTVPGDLRKAKEAKETGQAFRDLGEGVKNSKLSERLPEGMREVWNNLSGNSGVDRLFVPVESWNQYWQENQGVDPREVAKEILGDTTQYDDAVRTGKEIEIPTQEYATKIAPTDHNKFFSQEVRTPDQEMNERQALELEKKVEQEAQKAVEATKEPTAEEQIQEQVTGSLTAAGMDKVAAGKLALVVGQRYKARAQILGVDPLELFQQEAPGIQKLEGNASADAVAQFEQRAKRQSKADGVKKQLEAELGTELGIDFDEGDYSRDVEHLYDDYYPVAGKEATRAEGMGFDTKHAWYHGTRADIESFSSDTLGGSTGAGSARLAHFFASSPETASDYAEASRDKLSLRSSRTEGEAFRSRKDFTAKMREKYGAKWVSKLNENERTQRAAIRRQFKQSAEDFHFSQEAQKHKLDFKKYHIEQAERGVKTLESDLKKKAYNKKNKELREHLAKIRPLIENTEWIANEKGSAYHVVNKTTGEKIPNPHLNQSDGPNFNIYDTEQGVKTRVERIESRIKENTKENLEKSLADARANLDEMRKDYQRALEGAEGQTVYKTVLKMVNPLIVDFKGAEYREVTYRAILEKAKASGYDSVIFKNTYDPAFIGSMAKDPELMDVAAVFDASQIRAVSAEFDPAKADSPNILHQLSEGESALQKDTDVRGRFSITQDGLKIELSDKANLSTFIHETGHLYLHEMGKDVARLKAMDQEKLTDLQKKFLEDSETALKWLGVESFDQIKVEHHEKWARGFEAYHMEGKAPSLALRKVFASFRAWLISIYRQVKNLDVELSDEVRGVMDRMIATQEEIEAAQAESKLNPLFPDTRKAGMNDKQSLDYLKALDEAKREASESLTQKLVFEMQREQASWWKEEKNKVKEEVAKEVDAEKDQIAHALLTKGKKPDGSELPQNATGGFGPGNLKAIKINRASIERVIRAATLAGRRVADIEALPKIMSKTGGVDVDTAAEMLGYDYGEDLIAAMAKVENRKDKIERLADERMKERHGDLLVDSSAMKEEAVRAIHNEKRAQLLRMELQWLIENKFPQFKQGMKSVAKRVPSIAAVKQEAAEMLARMKVRDIRPEAFLRAEQKAAREAVDLYLKGDFEAAFDAKEKELLNHELYRAATESREFVDKTLEYMKKFRKESKRAQLGRTDYLEQIDAILHRFEFARIPEKELEARKVSLVEWLKEIEAKGDSAGEEVFAPDILKNEMFRKNYKDMTFEELQGVRDTVKQLEHMAIQSDKALAQEKKIRREEIKTSLIGSIVSNLKRRPPTPFTKSGKSRLDKVKGIAREFDTSLLKMEQVIDWLDGGDINGPWRQFLFEPASKAQAKEYDYTAKTTAKISELVHNIPKEIRARMNEAVKIPGIERKLTRRDLLGVALNTGNESNQTKMLKGMGWNEDQLKQMKDELTKEEWDFVQGIWNTLEDMWPEIAQLQKELTGLEPDKVEVRPVSTRHGEYKGGYYPMMYDPIASTTGAMQLSTKVGNLTEDGYTRATTPKGHTKSRVETFSAPLDLDIDNLPSHIAGVVKDLTHRKWLVDANWITSNREVRAAVAEHLGEEYVPTLTDWVKQVANDKNHNSLASLSVWRRMLTHFRYNAVIAAMGFKASTMLSQIAGIGSSIEVVGGKDLDGRKYMTRAYGEFLRAPMQKYKEVSEKSGEMRHRLETKDRDLRDKLRLLSGKTDILSQTQEVALYGIGVADMMVSVPTWMAGYQKALDQGKSEAAAIQAGDRAVRLSQGSSGAKDMAAVMSKNNDFLRTITMFYTPFSALYSRMRDVGHGFEGAKSAPQAAVRLFWVWIFANTMAEMLSGKGPDDDKGEDWLKWWLKSNLVYPFMSIPGLRDVVNGIAGDYGYTPSPLVQVGKSTARAGKTAIGVIEGKKKAEDLAKDTFAASQYWLGLPTKQIEITGGYWKHLLEGKESPDDLGEFTRKTLFKSERK